MKQLLQRLVSSAIMLMTLLSASAHDFEVDGIYYNINEDGSSVSVTFKGATYNDYSNEYSGAIVIPENVVYGEITYSVTSIGEFAFKYCTGLTSVTISNSVTSIGESAFSDCSRLASITIPNSVTSIGDSVFWYCTGLTSITIPDSVTSIGESVFFLL